MSFVLATSVFGFVFIVRRPEFYIPTSRYIVVIIGLFALFCYTQKLEQLGRALLGAGAKSKGPLSNSSSWDIHNSGWRVVDARYLAISLEPQKYFATTKHSRRLIVSGKLMKNLLPLVFAVLFGVACFVPAPASAYYYGGRYYRYSYRGHYYRYHYHGHYYRHRAWRGGYYRYW